MELARVTTCSQKLILLFLFFSVTISEPEGNGRQWYMTSDVKEVAGKSYDYIIVGGGTCGCPLAATLSHRFSVLLVERGSSPYGNPLVIDRNKYGVALLQTDSYASVAQSFISEDGVLNFRGRVLGGSSAINGGIYSRASDDYIEKAGWDKELVRDAYKWVESRVVFSTIPSPWQSVAEFSLLEAGILPYNGFSLKHIQGTKISGSVFDESGRRHTSADLLETAHPKNVTVLLHATVESIILHKNANSNVTRARGIKFTSSGGNLNETYEVYLKQSEDSSSWGDIILAAGALGSPQILLLSGIGPQRLLHKFNIPIVLDLEGVGQGMQDNPSIVVFVDTEPGKQLPDPPHVVGITDGFKIIIEAAIIPISLNSTRVNIAGKLALPKSRGSLELSNRDPRLNPTVKFNYFADESDLEECVKLTRLLNQVSNSKCIPLFLGEERKSKLITAEDDPRKLCKTNVTTYYHYHGGCSVGSVVDHDYRIYGVQGLRVLDGSTFADSPGTNPMATLLMLGRYQGIKILRERKAIPDTILHNIP